MDILKFIFGKGKTKITQQDKSTYYLDQGLTIEFCREVAEKIPKNMTATFIFTNGNKLELKTIDNQKIKKRINFSGGEEL